MNDEEVDAMLRDVSSPPPEGDHVDDRDLLAHRRGALSEAAGRRVERHLATCADCRDLYAELAEAVPPEVRARALETVRERRSGRGAWVAWGGAAAAALVLVALGTTRGSPLPDYALEGPHGGRQAVRGDDAPPPRVFTPDSRFELVVRPQAPVEGAAPHLWLFVGAPQGALERVDVEAERSDDGAFRIRTSARRALGAAPGPRELHAIVTPDAEAPPRLADAAALARFAEGHPHLRASLELVAPEETER